MVTPVSCSVLRILALLLTTEILELFATIYSIRIL